MKEFFKRGRHKAGYWYSIDQVDMSPWLYETKEEFDAGEQVEIDHMLARIEWLKREGFYPVDAAPDFALVKQAFEAWTYQPYIDDE